MPNLSDIRAANTSAVPNATDQIFAYKADGTPAAYTLLELSTYLNGVSYPQWLTDANSGCTLELTPINGSGSVPLTDGIVPFNVTVSDTGYYTTSGVMTIPTGVTRVQVNGGLKLTDTGAKLSLVKNGDTANPICVVESSSQYLTLVSPDFQVSATDTISVVLTASNSVFPTENTYMTLRAVEKLS